MNKKHCSRQHKNRSMWVHFKINFNLTKGQRVDARSEERGYPALV